MAAVWPLLPAALTITALLMNPLNRGNPEIENAPIMYRATARRWRLANPPNWVSLLRPVVRITTPAPMNSSALYRMWLYAWAAAPFRASSVPMPTAATMYPTWLMMWYARISRMSLASTA